MSLQERLLVVLREMAACPSAQVWVANYDLPTLEAYWFECPMPNWKCWLAAAILDSNGNGWSGCQCFAISEDDARVFERVEAKMLRRLARVRA